MKHIPQNTTITITGQIKEVEVRNNEIVDVKQEQVTDNNANQVYIYTRKNIDNDEIKTGKAQNETKIVLKKRGNRFSNRKKSIKNTDKKKKLIGTKSDNKIQK